MKDQKKESASEDVKNIIDQKINYFGKKFYNEVEDDLKSIIADKVKDLKDKLNSRVLLEQIKFFFKGIFNYQFDFLSNNKIENPFIKDIGILYGNKELTKIGLTYNETTYKNIWIMGNSIYPQTGDYHNSTQLEVESESSNNVNKESLQNSESFSVESNEDNTILKIFSGEDRAEIFGENLRKRLFLKSEIRNGIKKGVLKFCDGLYGLECYILFNFNFEDYKEKFDYFIGLVLFYVENYEEDYDEVKGDLIVEGFKISNKYDLSCFDEEKLNKIFIESK